MIYVPAMQAWMNILQQLAEKLRNSDHRDKPEMMQDKINNAKKTFRENGLRAPKICKTSEAEEWLKDMIMYKAEYKKVSSFLNSSALWAETMAVNEDQTRYVKWFTNKSNGVWEQLNSSEETVLTSWKEAITKCGDSLRDSLENNFFLEDMKKPISDAEQFKKLITCYNEAKKAFKGDETVYFAEELKKLNSQIAIFSKMPSPRDVSFDKYEGGSVRTQQLMWVYDKFGAVLKNENISAQIMEPVVWDCKEPHILKSQAYGFIIWNNKSWVWTHPKISFTIRYDFEQQRNVFQQIMPSKDPSGKKPLPPSLSDWQIKESGIQAVTVGKKDVPPAVPADVFWQIKGNLPPPIILLVASFQAIKTAVRGP